jgi:hypothetical protein
MKTAWLLAIALPGCFYDSRWGQEKTVQKHNAEAMAPAALTASPAASTTSAAKAYRVRVHATPAYVSQTIDWKHDTRELFEEANALLGPTLGVRLEVASMETWKTSKDDLSAAMTELRAEDSGNEAQWVIGLIGGLPKYAPSFDQIGLGEVFGKHLLLRSAIDLGEQDAIEGGLGEISADDRAKLVRDRRRHRSVSTLLHEIGHTLGAVHEDDKTVIMNPAYSSKMRGYGKVAPVLLRIGLARRDEADRRALFGEVLAYYKGNTESWIATERTSFMANLEKALGPAPAPSAAPPPKPKVDLSAVAEKDRPVFEQAADLRDQGKLAESWKLAKPLFAAYPKVFAVQDLRCQLAMKLATDLDAMRAECKQLMEMSTKKAD